MTFVHNPEFTGTVEVSLGYKPAYNLRWSNGISYSSAFPGRTGRQMRRIVEEIHHRSRPAPSSALLTVVVVVAVLYFARVVFIPLALSLLLAFLLAPLVIRLRRVGFGRVTAAAVVVLISFIAICVVTGIMASQVSDLAQRIPVYETNVRKKLESIRNSALVNRVTRMVHSVNRELAPVPSTTATPAPNEEKPVPVEIRRDPISPLDAVQKVLGSVIEAGLMAGIVFVFVIFMLIQREDLRDRIIRLAGESRINATTQVLDDAAHRVSKYLLAQLGVNLAFGILAGIGLYIIGVPNPLLWGMLAALLRYVPYLGIWIAALLPIGVAFAVEPGWVKVPAIIGLYFGIDLLIYNFVEPYLYGSSTGVSPIAILAAAVFWTWLWGPVGLLLATPLTVCVVVLGRYVPNLEFLSVILSDEKVLGPEKRLYQRMLAMDLAEATEIAEEYLKGRTLEALFDDVIIPSLKLAEEERHRGLLDETRQTFILQNTAMLIDDVAERADELIGSKEPADGEEIEGEEEVSPRLNAVVTDTQVLCIPVRDEADAIAAQMLTHLLIRRGIAAKSLPIGSLASESVEAVSQEKSRLACVTAIPPFGYMHARYLCRRLRGRFRDLKLVAAILTEGEASELSQRQPPLQADALSPSLGEALSQVIALIPVAEHSALTHQVLTA